ncbi:MAG: hypothetical protein E7551_01300 [Ruminococcaceae bacterium]|nr:hypothetical protein [Oscillospiraceae bacterium]
MKIIFLDIDGVLNSLKYDMSRSPDDSNIDITRLPLLKKLVDSTKAKIVLTSSWRKFWEKDEAVISQTGKEINEIFASAGLEIFDKTPIKSTRKDEILAWLSSNNKVKSFCIIDDMALGWEELTAFTVITNPRIGHGLEQRHIQKAVEILKNTSN